MFQASEMLVTAEGAPVVCGPPLRAVNDFRYDVFISYSSKDRAWARGELLKGIEKAGLKACIDYRDFKPGRSSLLNMQDAARHSRRLVLVLTEN